MRGGLAQMMAEAGGDKKTIRDVEKIENAPGGTQLLWTYAAEQALKAQGLPSKDAKKIRLYRMGGHVSANPYKAGTKTHREWNDKYASKGFSKRGNKDIPASVMRKARGGGVKDAAERTRQAGRNDDEILVHMTPEEFEVITAMWGEPDINPNTGMPEYGFLSDAWKGIKKAVKKVTKSPIFQAVAPVALSVFAPGLGTAVGMKLGLTGNAASIAGNALVQGGLGALSEGRDGFTRGALAGGLGAAAGAYGKRLGQNLGLKGQTADVVGSALLRGAGTSVAGGDFTEGAVQGGLGALTRPLQDSFVRDARRTMGLAPAEQTRLGRFVASGAAAPEAAAVAEEVAPQEVLAESAEAALPPEAPRPPPQINPSVTVTPPKLSLGQLAAKYALPAAALVGAFTQRDADDPGPPALPDEFTESLPVYTMNRQFRGLSSPSAYYTYGRAGAPHTGQEIFLNTADPFPMEPAGGLQAASTGRTGFFAHGGATGDYWEQNADVPAMAPQVSAQGRYVRGPGSGRSDDIDAKLSDGEYVIDAESVALLGDGSGDEGARRLDEMRRNLRKHKGKNLKKGEFTHKAKAPDQYMSKLRRRAKFEHGRANGGTI